MNKLATAMATGNLTINSTCSCDYWGPSYPYTPLYPSYPYTPLYPNWPTYPTYPSCPNIYNDHTIIMKGDEQPMLKNGKMLEQIYRISVKDIYGNKHDIILNQTEFEKLAKSFTDPSTEEESK